MINMTIVRHIIPERFVNLYKNNHIRQQKSCPTWLFFLLCCDIGLCNFLIAACWESWHYGFNLLMKQQGCATRQSQEGKREKVRRFNLLTEQHLYSTMQNCTCQHLFSRFHKKTTQGR